MPSAAGSPLRIAGTGRCESSRLRRVPQNRHFAEILVERDQDAFVAMCLGENLVVSWIG
jgi:hypothetical protein